MKIDEIYKLWNHCIEELKELSSFFSQEHLNNNFYRRLIIRNTFSIIEAYLHISRELIKHKLALNDAISKVLTTNELIILSEETAYLNNKGEVKSRRTFYSFEPHLKFTFKCMSKVFNSSEPNYSDIKYSKLIAIAKRRNDITHPKEYDKMIITKEELKDVVSALEWFFQIHGMYLQKFNM
mgnify:CR=1 FL=1